MKSGKLDFICNKLKYIIESNFMCNSFFGYLYSIKHISTIFLKIAQHIQLVEKLTANFYNWEIYFI